MSKSHRGTETFSVFGQIEAAAAESMLRDGVGVRIDARYIPDTARQNQFGDPALFAIMLPRDKVFDFEERIARLRA